MKRSELLTKLADARRYGSRALIPYLAILIVFALVTWWVGAVNENTANSRLSGALLLGFIALVYCGLIPTSILVKRFQRRTGLECPGCKKLLAGVHAQITMASGRCGHCGAVIIRDE